MTWYDKDLNGAVGLFKESGEADVMSNYRENLMWSRTIAFLNEIPEDQARRAFMTVYYEGNGLFTIGFYERQLTPEDLFNPYQIPPYSYLDVYIYHEYYMLKSGQQRMSGDLIYATSAVKTFLSDLDRIRGLG